MSQTLDTELTGKDLVRCWDALNGLSFSQIQTLVPNEDEDEAYLTQQSLVRLRRLLQELMVAREIGKAVVE